MTRWIAEHLGPDVPLHFTAFHPDFKMIDVPPTPPATLTRARRIAPGQRPAPRLHRQRPRHRGRHHVLPRLRRAADRARLVRILRYASTRAALPALRHGAGRRFGARRRTSGGDGFRCGWRRSGVVSAERGTAAATPPRRRSRDRARAASRSRTAAAKTSLASAGGATRRADLDFERRRAAATSVPSGSIRGCRAAPPAPPARAHAPRPGRRPGGTAAGRGCATKVPSGKTSSERPCATASARRVGVGDAALRRRSARRIGAQPPQVDAGNELLAAARAWRRRRKGAAAPRPGSRRRGSCRGC